MQSKVKKNAKSRVKAAIRPALTAFQAALMREDRARYAHRKATAEVNAILAEYHKSHPVKHN